MTGYHFWLCRTNEATKKAVEQNPARTDQRQKCLGQTGETTGKYSLKTIIILFGTKLTFLLWSQLAIKGKSLINPTNPSSTCFVHLPQKKSLPNLRVTLFTSAHLPWIHFLHFTHNIEFVITRFIRSLH